MEDIAEEKFVRAVYEYSPHFFSTGWAQASPGNRLRYNGWGIMQKKLDLNQCFLRITVVETVIPSPAESFRQDMFQDEKEKVCRR